MNVALSHSNMPVSHIFYIDIFVLHGMCFTVYLWPHIANTFTVYTVLLLVSLAFTLAHLQPISPNHYHVVVHIVLFVRQATILGPALELVVVSDSKWINTIILFCSSIILFLSEHEHGF
jgi:hypothetical protein